MRYDEREAANIIASHLRFLYLENKAAGIEKSTELALTLEQYAALAICRDLANGGVLRFDGSEESSKQLMLLVSNTIDLMYIQDAEKYRAIADEKEELFEIVVARAVSVVIRNWVNKSKKAES